MYRWSVKAQKTELRQFPRRDLPSCIKMGKTLLEKMGDSQVEALVAATTIGYTTLNGSAMTTLSALKQYGIIERPRGKSVSVSAVLTEVLKTNDRATLEEMAYRPAVFRHLRDGNYATGTDEVVSKHLKELGLTARAARDAVAVFRVNLEFLGTLPPNGRPAEEPLPAVNQSLKPKPTALPQKHAVSYTFPLANGDATVTFSAGPPEKEDMAILQEHLAVIAKTVAKRQK